MIMPRPLSGCQIKAKIKGFLLRYRLFQYKHWFLPIFELKDFPELTFTPCNIYVYSKFPAYFSNIETIKKNPTKIHEKLALCLAQELG